MRPACPAGRGYPRDGVVIDSERTSSTRGFCAFSESAPMSLGFASIFGRVSVATSHALSFLATQREYNRGKRLAEQGSGTYLKHSLRFAVSYWVAEEMFIVCPGHVYDMLDVTVRIST